MDWNFIANIAAFFSALAAAGGLIFTGIGLKNQARATDVSTYFKICEEIDLLERKLNHPEDGVELGFIYVEYFNKLDAIAHLYNKNKFAASTRKLCKSALLDHLAGIDLHIKRRKHFEKSVTHPSTYKDLRDFVKNHKRKLEERIACFKEYQNS